NSFAALLAGVIAGVATFAVEELTVADVAFRQIQLLEQRFVRLISSATIRTNAAKQSLAEHGLDGGRNQKRFYAHVDQARDRSRRVVRVQRGEDEMAGERCLNGNLGGLEIACFTDHDAIGILSQKRAQDAGEGETDRFAHRNLNDSFEIVLDWFFRGQKFGIDRVDLAQTRIKRRRFSRTGRAGGDEDSVRPIDDFVNGFEDVIRHAEHFEVEIHGRAIEHAQNNALAELRRQSAHAKIDMSSCDIFLDAPVLWQT